MLVGTFTFFADASYPVVAKTLRLQAAKAATQPATVQLVIRARPEAVPGVLAELQAYHATASFALLSGWSSYQVQAVTAAQDQVLADLAQGSRLGWVHTRRTLQREAAGAGMATTPVYLPPRDGLTLAGYLLARSAGAVPLGHVTWVRSTRTLRDSFQAGSVVVLDLDSSAAVAPLLDGLLERLKQEGLVAVPLALEASSGGARSSGD